MLVAWVLFPLVLLAVCLGCGLAVEWIAGGVLPGTLLPSLGLALVIVIATITTQSATTAPLTTWVVVAIALAGYASAPQRLRTLRPEPWAVGVALGVFAICAAPVVLSGNATFLGYFIDNDSAFHFVMIDGLLSHGTNVSGIPFSAYSVVFHAYLETAYPTGADVALGAVRPLVAQDVAWIFQPYLAVVLALGGTAVYELLKLTVRSHPMRALCAFTAAQAGLVYAFYLEDSIKELATTWLITVTVVLVFATLRRLTLRSLFPLILMGVAGLDVLDLAVVPWLGVPLAMFGISAIWNTRHALRRTAPARLLLATAAIAAVVVGLAAPIISKASTFLHVATSVLNQGPGSGGTQLGNLAAPLQHWQVFGIWPTGDFRFPLLTHYRIGYALIGIAIASAVFATLWMIRRRAFASLLLLAGNALAAAYLLSRSSPYAASKVLMIVSLTAVLTALLGGAALIDAGRRIEGWLLTAAIAGGIFWTNALAYSNASVAPRDRLAELAAIDGRFRGAGPTLYNQADEFAIHFLRDLQVSESATASFPARPGLPPRAPSQARLPWDPDDIDPAYLQSFRLLVLGRSPRGSRPPADYTLAYQGRYYDVWRRTASPTVLEHIPLGGELYPVAVPSCQLVMRTAAAAIRDHARLAYVAREPSPAFVPTKASLPGAWGLVQGDPYEVIPRQEPGAVSGTVHVPTSGTYQVWLESSLSGRFPVWVGGRYVSSVAYQLGPPGQFVPVGQRTFAGGNQSVRIERPGVNLKPGYSSTGMLLGPLMLVRDGVQPTVAEIAPDRARSLCGRSLDWLEIIR